MHTVFWSYRHGKYKKKLPQSVRLSTVVHILYTGAVLAFSGKEIVRSELELHYGNV